MRQARKTTRQGEGRRKRTPLGHQEQKLARVASKGMVGRWINDTGNRIAKAIEGDWKHVMESTGIDGEEKPVSYTVGVQDSGQPLIAYYMEIPQKFYREDQAAKQQQVDLIDDAIRHGNIEGEVGKDGRYIPNPGISVRTKDAP